MVVKNFVAFLFWVPFKECVKTVDNLVMSY